MTDRRPAAAPSIPFTPLPRLDVEWSLYEGFRPGSTVLPKGYVAREDYAPLPCDMLQERDVAFTLRDGVTIYMDVYRPLTEAPVPVILGWGPGGKSGMRDMLGAMPDRMRVPTSRLSGLQGWECADPADWVPHGYAAVQVDPRGCFMSEGDVQYFGRTDALDAKEVIDWLGEQSWSNGKVGFSGNSWYGMVQWFTAAEHPRHLAAIAPWEGQDDLYREEYVRGGIPLAPFAGARCWSDGGSIEDIFTMTRTHPLYDEYWASKRPAIEQIDVPVYVVASYSSWTHSQGTFSAWERLRTPERWLRVHATAEWPDYYDPDNLADLRRFFDRYLKDEPNGWELTPRVRAMALDLGHAPIGPRALEQFPPGGTTELVLALDAARAALSDAPPRSESTVTYDAEEPKEYARFTIDVTEEMEVIGYGAVRLFVEADGSDDMDVYVCVGKRSAEGDVLWHDAVGEYFYGAFGQLRVSHRELDPSASTAARPVHTHTSEQLLAPGQVVEIEIGLSPIDMVFHPGEKLELRVAGHRLDQRLKDTGFDAAQQAAADRMFAIDPGTIAAPVSTSRNRGRHILRSGGRWQARVVLPVLRG